MYRLKAVDVLKICTTTHLEYVLGGVWSDAMTESSFASTNNHHYKKNVHCQQHHSHRGTKRANRPGFEPRAPPNDDVGVEKVFRMLDIADKGLDLPMKDN